MCIRDSIYVDEVTQIGFAARLAMPVYKPRTFLSPGYQDNLGWGYATALGAQHARPDVPVLSINGDGGFLYTGNELATAMRHRIPLVAVVFADGAFGNCLLYTSVTRSCGTRPSAPARRIRAV